MKSNKTVEWLAGLIIFYATISVIVSFLAKLNVLYNSSLLLLFNPVYWVSLQYSFSGLAGFLFLIGFPILLVVFGLLAASLAD